MAVSKSLLAKISSSFSESANPQTAVGHGVLCQRLIALGLLQGTHSNQAFRQLAANLIRVAEHSIGIRDIEMLVDVSEVLMNLPLPEGRHAGAFYYALAMKREGETEYAQRLLEKISETPTSSCRARAMQTLGVMHHEQGKLDDAGQFYTEALRAGGKHDLIAVLSAHMTITAIKSSHGDHRAALSDLENLFSLFRFAARQYPFSFYLYHNALAVEFAELGRIAEAEAASAIALASPFAPAYPEWSDTRDEIAAKRVSATPSIVAIYRPSEAAASPQPGPKPKPRPVAKLASRWLVQRRNSFQRSIIPIPATATTAFNAVSILDRVLSCIGSRAPPA